jgi:hypothetical protein
MNYSVFHGRGGCGIVRGIQVAEFLGAKDNPTSGYENDTCIYVKVIPPKDHPKHSYFDVVDAAYSIEWLKENPDIGVIAISDVAKDYLEKELGRKDIIRIPHHHCNYERIIRPDRPVQVVGIIGSQNSFQYPIEEIRKALEGMGLKLLYNQSYWKHFNDVPTREGIDGRHKVINFYNRIDIQIVWRVKPWSPRYDWFRNPLKLENAGSFRIPTVAYPEPSYVREWGGSFIAVDTIQKLLAEVELLKNNPEYYHDMSMKALIRADDYHMDEVKQLYLQLP